MRDLADFYDVGPKVIQLLGGPNDGERVNIGYCRWPDTWRMPRKPSPSIRLYSPEDEPNPVAPTGHPAYRHTGSTNDRGERIYQYVGDL